MKAAGQLRFRKSLLFAAGGRAMHSRQRGRMRYVRLEAKASYRLQCTAVFTQYGRAAILLARTDYMENVRERKGENTMKNKRKLAVISLVVMMMVTAVGYAAFSDSLTVFGGAASATFDVQFARMVAEGAEAELKLDIQESEKSRGPLQSREDILLFGFMNVVPGKVYTATGTIENHGSINAKFGSIKLDDAAKYFDVWFDAPSLLAPWKQDGYAKPFTINLKLKDEYSKQDEGVTTPFVDLPFTIKATVIYTQE